ncbi:MAG: GNAT family N-acetyltransferase [Bryobacteraceae bacterium]|jgi:ribosomal protein S18 acetylase RimI-like enzyme
MGVLSRQAAGPEIVGLRDLAARELDPLLLEETVEWQRELDWDFGRSADLVRQFADMRALTGFALLDRGEVAGYGYSVLEDHKGLIGDLYIRPSWRDGVTEARLFQAILDDLIGTPHIRRVESQLMLVGPAAGAVLQRERCVNVRERVLMSIPTASASLLPAGAASGRFHLESWAEHHHESAAGVIALAYLNHVDSQINDQYRTPAGARRFIYNIVQFPGCGTFFKPASFVAFDPATGWLAGIVLVSFVGDRVGHITQLCVTPGARGKGLGYELLRQAIGTLRLHGAERISLTVTGANTEAIRLYERCGFHELRRFSAYVWEN